jgi:F-type H+-transporting ATPase subunit delta
VQGRLDRSRNVVEATLVTSAPLAQPEAERLRTALEGRTGRTVRLTRAVDPALLGGFVVRVGSEVYDASLAHRLRKTRQALHGGAAQEGNHG